LFVLSFFVSFLVAFSSLLLFYKTFITSRPQFGLSPCQHHENSSPMCIKNNSPLYRNLRYSSLPRPIDISEDYFIPVYRRYSTCQGRRSAFVLKVLMQLRDRIERCSSTNRARF
jgi:hypothetical protein